MKSIDNRRWLANMGIVAMLLACVPATLNAQSYPSKPIRFIVPYPPGGNTDIVGRTFAQKLSERLGQPIVIENRGGAAGSIGMAVAAKSPADGYTLVIGDLGSLVIAALSNPALSYKPQTDFAPISLVTAVSIVVTVNPKSPDTTFEELLARAVNLGARALDRMRDIQHRHPLVSHVRGIGLLLGIELARDGMPARREAEQVMYRCLADGLSFKIGQGNVLTLSPPLVIAPEDLDRAFAIIDAALAAVEAGTA